ncbi:hypothetical protein AB4Z30_04485 [Paenibacillus sp. 2TAF8]|uniref:hypothetical protein n=1 Tax=Paenibacillus sp. 2TAF8 TaxID=3233020 RepID=UPI003F9EB412
MQLIFYRIQMVAFFLISVLLLATGKFNIFEYVLTCAVTVALIAIGESLFSVNHSRLDLFVKKLRAFGKVLVIAVLTVFLIKGIVFLFA